MDRRAVLNYSALLIGAVVLALVAPVLPVSGIIGGLLAIATVIVWLAVLVSTCVLASGWLIAAVERRLPMR